MPIDHSFEHSPSFRDLTQNGLLLLCRPLVRSLRRLEQLRRGAPDATLPLGHFAGGLLSARGESQPRLNRPRRHRVRQS